MVVAGVTAIVVHDDPPPDARAALRAAQRVVQGSDSFRFQMLETSRVTTGDGRRVGSDTTTRMFRSGTVEARNRWHLVEELDESVGLGLGVDEFEAIRVGPTLYATTGLFGTQLSTQFRGRDWIAGPATGLQLDLEEAIDLYEELDAELPFLPGFGTDRDAARLDLILLGHLFARTSEPSELAGVIERATDPTFAKELPDGGMRLRTRLPAVEALADLTDDRIRVRMELDVDEAGSPTRVELAARLGRASGWLVIRFRDWGADLSVDPPDEDDVERTPWVSEEDLAALDPELLLAPTEVPAGFALISAEVVDDGDGCISLDLEYEDELDYLSMSVVSEPCGYDLVPFDLELGGRPARGGDGFWDVEVGRAVVYLDTSLDDATTGEVAASIAPTSVDALVEALAEGGASVLPPNPFDL
jgi:hypothetical protein